MDSTPKFLLEVRQRLSEFSGKNRKIVERIINFPECVIQEKACEFAKNCHCDSAQVVRLCQRLGYSGYLELKSRIATELIDPKRTLYRQIVSPSTTFEELKKGFSKNFTRTINDTLANLSEGAMKQAINMISTAKHIVICGFGSSGLAARDLQIKLLRIGFDSMFFDDVENGKTTIATFSENDLLILVSFSGETTYILDYIKIAKKNNIPVLALTNYLNSSLGKGAACILPTTADEQRLRLGTMDSTIAQFLLVDLICSSLALKAADRTEKRILQIFEVSTTEKR